MKSSRFNGVAMGVNGHRSGVVASPRAKRGSYHSGIRLTSKGDVDLTPLQTRVAREIVAYARRENLKAGEHLAESLLAEQIGTSRTPVNVALRHLAALGMLSHDLNRGYFLNKDALSFAQLAERFSTTPDDPLYLRIAEDRLASRLDRSNRGDDQCEAEQQRNGSAHRGRF